MEGSKLFESYRALGYYTNHIPPQIMYHERLKENFIVTCVGKSYHIYNASKLGISRVSDPQDSDITCMLASGNRIYIAVGTNIRGIDRNKQDVLEFKKHKYEVHTLVAFGKHFLSVDESSHLIVWSIETQEAYFEMNFSNEVFQISTALHPATYVNKALLASVQGSLQLWNIKTNKKVYEFSGWGHAVTVIKQAPAVDVIGIGLDSGDIYIQNIKFDEVIMKFTQDWGPVTGLAFRTDGIPVMISGSSPGHLAVWNLDDKRLSSQIRDAHDASVTGLECLAAQPLMVTSSADNNLKVWIFDQSDGGARLLHRRQGHSAPVSHLRFYDDTNMIRHSKSMGRAVWKKKADVKRCMPLISQICCESKRASDWDDVITVHSACSTVSLWSSKRSTLSHHLSPHKASQMISSALSPCGHFGFLGYKDGSIHMFNMQSRISRGQFKGSCKGPVRSMAVDGMSRLLVSSSADSRLIIWNIKSKTVAGSVRLDSPISFIRLHQETAMVAVALDDFSLVIVDLETMKLVRRFPGHSGRITDMAFNSSGKWLTTASMDCTVSTWDMLSGSLIDRVNVMKAIVSLDFSPRGEFLAVSMLGEPGLFLWSNKSLYMHVSLKALNQDGEELADLEGDFKSADQLSNELITLSLLPESRWANLLKLDIIKYRNRLRAPPKVQKSAPFFLPTLPGLVPMFAIDQSSEKTGDNGQKRNFTSSSGLDRVLVECVEAGDAGPYLTLMKSFGLATIESEISCLETEPGQKPDRLRAFLQVTRLALETQNDYELVHSYLSLFLKVHNEEVMGAKELVEELKAVQQATLDSWEKLDSMLCRARCLTTFQRSSIL
ncbi:WD repeat-containing protein 36-like isoform X2 [Watersipora subatra]|uniref:WD repeat-containing protein 36-like isoform X2 n=1 Tax=Watersipora subatra TaxID=2589382 RepID=UPI00355B3EB1